MDETVVSKSVKKARTRMPVQKPADIEVEPVSPSMYNLTYACVLIPRFPHHHLTGEVAKYLSEWITQLSVAFGWRLEHLSLRPDYMQWLVNVPPNTSPGYLMRTIRQHTSRRMFIEFPDMERDNPSGDFWAPGYLILGNPQPPPATLVQEFIANTRQRQGLHD
jgi:REP element-mobilizing transposase RayT